MKTISTELPPKSIRRAGHSRLSLRGPQNALACQISTKSGNNEAELLTILQIFRARF